MLLLVEGPDGAGKTTIVNEIAQLVPVFILKRNAPTRHCLVEYTAELGTYQPGSGAHIVCDRWHLGEAVYGPMYRGKSGLSPVEKAAVEALLNRLGAIGLLVQAPVDTLVQRLQDRGETPDAAALRRESQAFARALTWSQVEWRRTDTSQHSAAAVARDITRVALDKEQSICASK